MELNHNQQINDPEEEQINTYKIVNNIRNPQSEPRVGQKRQREDANNARNLPNQNQVKFICPCQQEISDLTQLEDHMKRCEQMSLKYGSFLGQWNDQIEKAIDEENLEKWKNFRSFYEHFREKFMEGIKIVRDTKRRKQNNKETAHIEHLEVNEIKNEKDYSPNKQLQLNRLNSLQINQDEEEKFVGDNGQKSNQDIEMAIPVDQGLNCVGCNMLFLENDYYQVIFLESCCHVSCKKCLQDRIKESYPDVSCPKNDCEAKLNDLEIRTIIGQKEYEELEKNAIDQALEGTKNLVKCNCGNVIEVVKGEIYYDFKKDDGSQINKLGARHMSQFRVRCPDCGNNFCSSCKVEPYHIGYNCNQYEKMKAQKKCRFCGSAIKNGKLTYCSKRQCKNQSYRCCATFLECGHPCYGIGHEQNHPPCLHEECVAKDEGKTLGENADSFCVICYVQGLGEKPIVQLECKHIFHSDCIMNKVYRKWDNLAINFQYAHCPSCNQWINAPGNFQIEPHINQAKELEKKVLQKCVQRAKHEGLDLDERLQDPKYEYHNDLEGFAFNHLNYYQCWKCQNPFFGGLKQCDGNANLPQANNNGLRMNMNAHELICPKCRFEDQNQQYGISYCQEHGDSYIQYKCNFCCNIAAYHCGGTNYYCMFCHDRKGPEGYKCKNKDDCPLKVDHPPNGQIKAFAVGCGMCKELKIGKNLEESFDEQIKDYKEKMEKMKAELVDF